MKKLRDVLLLLAVLLVGWLPFLTGCVSAGPAASAPGAPAAAPGGSRLWAENCMRCHNVRSPSSYSDAEWVVVMQHMRIEKDGARMAGGSVRVRHDSPGGMMMMGPPDFYLYDDGTHGDRIAGDGLYCFEDAQGQYGCHTDQAPRGSHHYDFMGMDSQGHKSNQMRVTVTIR